MADTSAPKTTIVALVGFLSAIFLFVVLVLVLYFLPISIQSEIHSKIEDAPTVSLDSLRADETVKLTQPAYVDKAAGVVRIPIDRAMELEARHSWRADLPQPASTFPTTTTQSTHAATTSTLGGSPS